MIVRSSHASIRRLVWLLVILAGTVAAISFAWTLAVLSQPGEVNYGEAIIHDQAARLLRGEALYQPLYAAPYSVTAYTPVYYVIVAALQALFGPGFAPGRLVSLASGGAAALIVGHFAWRQTRSRIYAALAALLFLGLSAPWNIGPPWWSFYKEDALGVTLSFGAIGILSRGTRTRGLLVAGALAGLAILTKQTFLAAAAAGTIWLLRRRISDALVYAATSLLVAFVPCIALEAAGGAFFANTVWANANPSSVDVLRLNLSVAVVMYLGPLAVCLLHLRGGAAERQRGEESLLVIYWLCSAVPLLGLVKVGSNYNYWLEFAGPTAALTAVCLAARARAATRAAALTPHLFLSAHLAFVLSWFAVALGPQALGTWTSLAIGRSQPPALSSLVDRVAVEPREVLGRSFDVVTLAGRRNYFEPDIYSIFHHQGLWDPSPVANRIRAGEVGLVILDAPLDDPEHWAPRPIAWWPTPIMEALRETMVLESQQAGRWVYVPRATAVRGGSSSGQ